MGRFKLNEVQKEMLQRAEQDLANVQQNNQVMLTAMLAGDGVRVAKNVRIEEEFLVWDDPDEGGEDGGDEDEPTGPELLEEQKDAVAEAMGQQAQKEASSEQPGAATQGESVAPAASAPEEEASGEGADPALELEEPASV